MRIPNLILIIISIVVLVYDVVVSAINYKREIDVRKRKNIAYNNYTKYRLYYNLKINRTVIIVNIISYVLSIVMCFLLVFNESLVYYVICFAIAILTNLLGLLLYISSVKFNINLMDFDNYYNMIKTNYANKETLTKNIVKLEDDKKTINNKIDALNNECAKIFMNHQSITGAETCLDQLNEVLSQQYDMLKSFDSKTSELFTKSLRTYLKSHGTVDASIFIMNESFIVDLDSILNNAIVRLREIFKRYVVSTFIESNSKSKKDVENVVECLNKLDGFTDYYQMVQEFNKTRGILEDNLKRLEDLKEEINDKAILLKREFKRLFPRESQAISFSSSTKDIELYITNGYDLISKFDESYIQMSIMLMQDYLNDKPVNKSKYLPLTLVDPIDFVSLRTNAIEAMKSVLTTFVEQEFNKGTKYNPKELVNICEYLQAANKFNNDYAMKLIDYIAVDASRFEAAIDFLFINKHITYDLLTYCNSKGYEWIYARSVSSFLTVNQLTELMVNMIEKNLMQIAIRYLLLCDKSDIDHISNALNVSKTVNDTRKLVENYISLLQLDGGFNMLSTRYENITIALRYYYLNRDGQENDTIKEIISSEEFYENKDYLDKTYSNEIMNIEPLLIKTFRSLLYYSLYCTKVFDSLINNKLNELYVEYKKTLNFKGLLCLSALLDSIMLININNRTELKEIIENINNKNGVELYDEYYPLTGNKDSNNKLYARDIIRNLIDNHFAEITAIINYSEKERLFIDKIRYA